jgi:hypothetical protein
MSVLVELRNSDFVFKDETPRQAKTTPAMLSSRLSRNAFR